MRNYTSQATISARSIPAAESQIGNVIYQLAVTMPVPPQTFGEVRHLYSDRPLRVNTKVTQEELAAIEDMIDASDSQQALQEVEHVSLEDFRKELGM